MHWIDNLHRHWLGCPLWVKSRHRRAFRRCPLYPQKRTLKLSRVMSALCQKRTHAVQQNGRFFRPEPHYAASDCLAARIVVSVNLRPRPGRPACFVVRVRFCAIELLQASYFTLSHRIRRGSRLLKRLPGRPANLGRYAFRCRPGRQIPDPSFYSIQQSFGPAP